MGSRAISFVRDFLGELYADEDEIRRLKHKVNVLIGRLRDERENGDGEAEAEAEAVKLKAARAEVTRLADELHKTKFDNGRYSIDNLELRRESQQKDAVIAEQGAKLFKLVDREGDVETLQAELIRERDARETDSTRIQKRLRVEYADQIAGLKAQIASRDVELTAVRAHSAETEILLMHAADEGGGGNTYAVFRLRRLADAVLDLVSAALAADAVAPQT